MRHTTGCRSTRSGIGSAGGRATVEGRSSLQPTKNPVPGVARFVVGAVIAAAGAALLVAGVLIAAATISDIRHPVGLFSFAAPSIFIPFGLFVGALGILGLYAGSRLGGWWQRRQHISRVALGLVGIASASFVIIAGLAWPGACDEELGALEAVQPYDDVTYSRARVFGRPCFVTFPADERDPDAAVSYRTQEVVASYYARELMAQGWTTSRGGKGLLDAERGTLRFRLILWGPFGASGRQYFEIDVWRATDDRE